jgi:hypothetical protein
MLVRHHHHLLLLLVHRLLLAVHLLCQRQQQQDAMVFSLISVVARGSRRSLIQRREIAVQQQFLGQSPLQRLELALQRPEEGEIVVWLEHWLVHLQLGRLKLVTVVSANLCSIMT